MNFPRLLAATALCLLPATAALAQQNFTSGIRVSDSDFGEADLFVTDTSVLDGDVCIGNGCALEETFAFGDEVKLKGINLHILFDDTSPGTLPDRDWRLRVNDTESLERFSIEDVTQGTIPFTVAGGTPDNAMWIDSSGDVGLGTSIPEHALHIVENGTVTPAIALERTTLLPSKWFMNLSALAFNLSETNVNSPVFTLQNGAPSGSFHMNAQGLVGLGTTLPEGKLHTKGDGVQLAYFESGDGGPVQVRFRTDSENRRFLATNNADEVQSQVIFKDDEILFTGTTDRGADRWMSISQAGLVTQGPSCNPGPCDAVFDPEVFEVPSIEEHAAYMWENRHLKAVGPTGPDTPVNLTEKVGGILHELELAHIYIEKLHEDAQQKSLEMAGMKARHAREMAVLSARLEALESK